MKIQTTILLLALCTATAVKAQEITVVHDTINLGNIVYNHPVTAEFELQNTGRSMLNIKTVETSCGCTTAHYPSRGINKGRKFTIGVSYDARQLGHFEKFATIKSNAKGGEKTLWLRGVVISGDGGFDGQYNYVLGSLKVDKTDLEFDDVNRADRPVAELHIMNNGQENAEPQLMHLPPYLSATVIPRTIMPAHSAVARITLDPSKLHNFGLTQTSIFLGSKPGEKVSPDKEITVSAVLLPKFANSLGKARPHAVISTYNLNLNFEGKDKAKGVIVIQNTGRTTLQIRSLQLFTDGLRLKLNSTKIAPGNEAKLKITAIKDQLQRVRTQPRVLMITNDPENAKIIITVNAK